MNMEFAGFPYLSAILLSCVAGLLVILFIPRERETLVKGVSLVFSGIALALSIYVYCAYDRAHGGLQFVEKMRGWNRWESTTSTGRTASTFP